MNTHTGNGKALLVTGAVRNTGLAIARRFASDGWNVAVTSRDASAAKATTLRRHTQRKRVQLAKLSKVSSGKRGKVLSWVHLFQEKHACLPDDRNNRQTFPSSVSCRAPTPRRRRPPPEMAALLAKASSVDLELKRRDVEHLLFHRERATVILDFPAFVAAL